jgi:hypothetical protein
MLLALLAEKGWPIASLFVASDARSSRPLATSVSPEIYPNLGIYLLLTNKGLTGTGQTLAVLKAASLGA